MAYPDEGPSDEPEEADAREKDEDERLIQSLVPRGMLFIELLYRTFCPKLYLAALPAQIEVDGNGEAIESRLDLGDWRRWVHW